MLHILLFILKIIGIVLLCILGVLLLGIACALFVPVRYRVEAVRKEGEEEPPVAITVKVTWLLHLINVCVRFAGSLSVRARIMIFTVFRIPRRKKSGGRAKSGKAGRQENTQPSGTDGAGGEGVANASERELDAENPNDSETKAESQNAGQTLAAERTAAADEADDREDENGKAIERPGAEDGKKPGFWDKLRAIPKILHKIFIKLKNIFENIQYTIQNFCDKIKSISDTIEYYRDVVEGEPFQRSFALCKRELLQIVKSLKPDKFEASLIVGTDDPAATGEILAVCGMLYPILGPRVNVAGDFEKKRLEGRVFLKGKLRFFTFIRAAVRVYFNKDIRKLYGLLKKEAV